MTQPDKRKTPTNVVGEAASFTIESHYAKQPDGYVYYYWRIQGSDTWNVQKTAMKDVPTVEMVMDIGSKIMQTNLAQDWLDEIILEPAHWQLDDYLKAKAELSELVASALPKKKVESKKTRTGEEFYPTEMGYNQALQDIKANLESLGLGGYECR